CAPAATTRLRSATRPSARGRGTGRGLLSSESCAAPLRNARHPSGFALNARQIERHGLSNGLNRSEAIKRGINTAHKKTRRLRRDEGGRFGPSRQQTETQTRYRL